MNRGGVGPTIESSKALRMLTMLWSPPHTTEVLRYDREGIRSIYSAVRSQCAEDGICTIYVLVLHGRSIPWSTGGGRLARCCTPESQVTAVIAASDERAEDGGRSGIAHHRDGIAR